MRTASLSLRAWVMASCNPCLMLSNALFMLIAHNLRWAAASCVDRLRNLANTECLTNLG